MKNKRRFLAGFLGLVAIAAVAWAKSEVSNPHWLSKAEIRAIVQQESPPPAAGSPAEQADLQAELAAQASRTPARIAESKEDANYSVTLFTNMIGPKITPKGYPKTFEFFEQLNKQIGQVVGESKDHWHRLRPYHTHPEIHPLFEAGGFSYPSGHSTHSFAFAVILGQLFPDKAAAFMDRAHQIARSRVDAGVHYTTDINEGEVVGREIAKELLAKPDFQAQLDAVKAELAGKN